MSIFLVIAILVLLIVVHELGHFIVAKLTGVNVKEFGVGYPPRAWLLRKIKGTEYTLNWLPFGGFVRLYGEDETEAGPGSFSASSRGTQALILVAGVVANMFMGWLLFTGGFVLGMPAVVPSNTPGAQLLISSVVKFSPAHDAGLQVGDEIVSISSSNDTVAFPLTPEGVSSFIGDRGGDSLTLTYRRNDIESTASLVPIHAVIPGEEGRPAVGIALTSIAQKRLPFGQAILAAGEHTISSFVAVIIGLYSLASDALMGGANIDNLVGPVGLVSVVNDASGQGLGHVLALAAFISINLAIINLIPIPALDGGRLLFVGIEAITRRHIPHVVYRILNMLGFLFIILLMLIVTFNDVARLVS